MPASFLSMSAPGGKLTEADITALLDEMEQQVLQEIQAELEQWSQMEQHAREEERQAGINLEQHQQFVSTAGRQGSWWQASRSHTCAAVVRPGAHSREPPVFDCVPCVTRQ